MLPTLKAHLDKLAAGLLVVAMIAVEMIDALAGVDLKQILPPAWVPYITLGAIVLRIVVAHAAAGRRSAE